MTPTSTELALSKAEGFRTGNRQQRGSTLLVALIMLVLLTLIALSAMKSTTASIQVVGNAQFREEAKAAAQKAIELVLSDSTSNNFRKVSPVPQNIDVNGDGTTDYTVSFAPAPCWLSKTPVDPNNPGVPPACAASGGLAVCFWTQWDIRAVVNDVNTGAGVILHQGVKTISGLKDVLGPGC